MRKAFADDSDVRVVGRGATLDMHLVIAMGAVLIALVAEQVLQSGTAFSGLVGALLSLVTHGLLVLTVLYSLCAVLVQWIALALYPTSARSVFIVAASGSFLLGSVATLFVTANHASVLLAGLGIGISIIALIGFVLFLPAEVESEPGPEPPGYDEVQTELPPLFVDDPLFKIPQATTSRLFVQAKSNDMLVNCEDACAISPDEMRFALSDGTSSSNLPRPWAALLAQQWVRKPLIEVNETSLAQWLEKPREHWQSWVYETWLPTINQRNQASGGASLPLERAQEVVKGGAFATLLGVAIDRKAGQWWAMAVGDTCLFHFRPNEKSWRLKSSFPLQSSTDFNDIPPSLNSHVMGKVGGLLPHVNVAHNTCRRGDVLVLATDALAAWFFKQIEQGTTEWQKLLSVTDERRFAQFVDWSRSKGQLNDDDTTLIIIPI